MYNYLVSTGVIVPDTSLLQTEVQNEFFNAFGDDLIITDNTPQGVLIVGETAARSTFLQSNAALANQINPNLAGGVFLDAIWELTGGERTAAFASTVTVDVTGVAGTILPIGSIVAGTDGTQFASTTVITLNGSGLGSGVFKCTVNGPVAALADTLTTIIEGVLGWETANNPDDAVLGAFTQSDASARTQRKVTLGAQGSALSEAIIAAVSQVPDETSMSFRENILPTTHTVDGITMLPNSIYCCVAGGTDLNVATAIYSKKSGGCQYTDGASSTSVTQTVVDPYSGQSNVIKFDRPDELLVLVQVNYASSSAIVDPTTAVKAAVLAYAAGLINGQPGFAVGRNISPFEIMGAISQVAPNLFIKSVLICFSSTPSYAPVELAIALWQQGFTNSGSITVNPV